MIATKNYCFTIYYCWAWSVCSCILANRCTFSDQSPHFIEDQFIIEPIIQVIHCGAYKKQVVCFTFVFAKNSVVTIRARTFKGLIWFRSLFKIHIKMSIYMVLSIIFETDLSIISLIACSPILTWFAIACRRHFTTYTIIFWYIILLATSAGLTIACTAIIAGDIITTGQKLAKISREIFRAITCCFVSVWIYFTSSSVLAFCIRTKIGFTFSTDEWEDAIATECYSTSIIKASTSIL